MNYNRKIAKEITKIQLKFKIPNDEYKEEILKIAPDYPQKYFKQWHKDCMKYKDEISDSSSGPGTEYFLGYLDAIKELNYDIDLIINATKKWRPINKRKQAIDKWLQENCIIDKIIYPDDIDDNNLFEGTKKQITVNAYERSSQARQECINHYGYKCQICDFDFEKVYGEIGKDFIHVHHVLDISTIGKNYKVNPIKDLIPVCPNCHAMLHKRKPAYKIEEIQSLLVKKLITKPWMMNKLPYRATYSSSPPLYLKKVKRT